MERLIGRAFAATGAMLAAIAPAPAQPPETAVVALARYACAAELSTQGGTFQARRMLDASGRTITSHAHWVEGPPGRIGEWLTTWIEWSATDNEAAFAQGRAHFHFETDRSWDATVRIGFVTAGSVPIAAQAHPVAARPTAVTAQVPVASLIENGPDDAALDLMISGPTAEHRAEEPIKGRYALTALREAQRHWPDLIRLLDDRQADFRVRCATIGAPMLAKSR